MNWLCWHVGTSTDPKWIVVSKRCGNAPKHMIVATWAHLLERAKERDDEGKFGEIDYEVSGAALDIDPEILRSIVRAMEEKDCIKDGKIVNWIKRNHGTTSTERVRKFRERQKQNGTEGNVTAVSGTNETAQDRQTGHYKHNIKPPKPPSDETRPIRNGRRRSTGDAVGALAVTLVNGAVAEWRLRLMGYGRNGYWADKWGPKPGDPNCDAPGDLIAEILNCPARRAGDAA